MAKNITYEERCTIEHMLNASYSACIFHHIERFVTLLKNIIIINLLFIGMREILVLWIGI